VAEIRNACTTHLFFYFRETEKKIKFGGIQVLLDYRTKGDTMQESTPQAKFQSITLLT